MKTSKIQDQTEIEQEQTRIRDEIADAINTDFEQSEIEQIPINEMYLGGGQNDIGQEQTRFCDEILQEQTRICDEIADAINTNSRFSDILFSDKPRFSDNFAEDRFFTT